jgi:Recombinase
VATTSRAWGESPIIVHDLRKVALVSRLRALQAQGLSHQAITTRLNVEGMPTLSGKGTWQKGTVSNLLAQGPEEP